MNRRLILKGFFTTIMSSLVINKAMALEKVNSFKSGDKKDIKQFVEETQYKSNLNPSKKYNNISQFWNDHPDRESNVLKQQFLAKGLLVSSTSRLLDDGSTVSITKIYKNESARELYRKIEKSYFTKKAIPFPADLRKV